MSKRHRYSHDILHLNRTRYDYKALHHFENNPKDTTTAWEVNLAGDGCDDIDECNTGQDDCHVDAFCTNNDGSFICTCNPTYSGDGITTCLKDACDHGNFYGPDLNCEPMPINAECNLADSCITFICSHGYELNPSIDITIRQIFL